jgi:hypothetical protein
MIIIPSLIPAWVAVYSCFIREIPFGNASSCALITGSTTMIIYAPGSSAQGRSKRQLIAG